MSEAIFELDNISYSYLGKIPALCGVDLKVEKGERIALVGANGSGKSTLLQLLDGLIFPDKGIIKAFGEELNESQFDNPEFSRNFRKKVAFLFQSSDVQLFSPTVKEDILFGPLQLGVPEGEIKKLFHELVDIFGLEKLLERSPHQLSVGEKRKVAIAGTLAINPEVIILDEPTAGLDPRTVRQIIDIILDYSQKGKTIITATHDLHILGEIADKVYVFGSDKKIIRSGAIQEILSDKQFLEDNNLMHIHSHRHQDKIHVHSHEHLGHHHEGSN